MTDKELREIDARIGQALFGWRWYTHKRSGEPAVWVILPEGPYGVFDRWDNGKVEGGTLANDWDRGMPRYSSDVASAWEVVEAFWRRGISVLFRTALERTCPVWEVMVYNPATDTLRCEADESVAVAICRAALALTEGEGDG